MNLKGKPIVSKATGIKGQITGVKGNKLTITFTTFQDIAVPVNKAESLFEMDKETLEEVRRLSKVNKNVVEESKVETYMDNFEEEEEEVEEETTFDYVKSFEEDV